MRKSTAAGRANSDCGDRMCARNDSPVFARRLQNRPLGSRRGRVTTGGSHEHQRCAQDHDRAAAHRHAGAGRCGGGEGTSMIVSPGVPATPVDMGVSEIDVSQFLTPAVNQSGAPGMIAAIVDGDGVRAIGADGVCRQGSPEDITGDDLVHLGSVTKAMTSTMLATLVEDGTFANGWNTTVAETFPELAGSIHQDYDAVTVGQPLRMRGDLPRNPADWSAYSNDPDIVARRCNILRDNLANASAGAVGGFEYFNLSHVLADAMAGRLTGRSRETLTQERLFAPLGITTGGFGPPGTPGEVDQPWGHTADRNDHFVPSQDDLNTALGPAGTVHISIEDWAKAEQRAVSL